MGKAYSQDLRERVIATVDSGTRVCAAARLFLVSVSYVSKVVDRRRTTGETTARVGRAGRKPKLAPHDQAIRARVAAHPDATLEDLTRAKGVNATYVSRVLRWTPRCTRRWWIWNRRCRFTAPTSVAFSG